MIIQEQGLATVIKHYSLVRQLWHGQALNHHHSIRFLYATRSESGRSDTEILGLVICAGTFSTSGHTKLR